MKIGGISNKSIKNLMIKSYEDIKILKKNKIGNFFTIILKNFSKIKQFF
jgi:glycosyltransferase